MKTNEKVKKNGMLKVIISLILIVTIVILAGIAYARYVTSIGGQTEAQIAKWSFKVVDGDANTINVLDFPITRTDSNTEVDINTIAPGTYGMFEIDVDARGTETILNYGISIEFTNKPQNMKFYADENMTNEIQLDNNGRLVLSKFLSLDDVKNIQSNIIYWNWPLETGTTQAEIDYNDGLDSQFIGKTLTMAITVTGTQAMENGVTVTYDKNYFEKDLLSESEIIKTWYNVNYVNESAAGDVVKSVQIIDDSNAKYGKSIKIIFKNGNVTVHRGPYIRKVLETGKKYTWSMYIKTNGTRGMRIGNERGGVRYINTATEWTRYTYTFIADSTIQTSFIFYNYGETWNEDDTLEFHSLELMEGEPTDYTTTIEKNSNLGTTITPKRTDYEFLGWYTDPVAGERVTSSTIITQDTTLYAHWRFIE